MEKPLNILMPQDYGDEVDWKEHFDYLITVFNDPRYIKIDNKPIFIKYRSSSIPQCSQMLEYWEELAKEAGLPGIYFINTLSMYEIERKQDFFHAQLYFEPTFTLSRDFPLYKRVIREIKSNILNKFLQKKWHIPKILLDSAKYDAIWRRILKRKPSTKKITFPRAFVDWDNTARRKSK